MDEDTVQYRFYFVADYSETESIVVAKFHHCLGDGMALMLAMGILQDEYKPQ